MRAPCGARILLFRSTYVAGLRGLAHILRGRTLGALHDVELHGVAFSEGLEPAACNGAVVHEAIFRAVIGCDEAEPLRVVEPLHFAGRTHSRLPERTHVEGAERAEP